jgi:hypothetical protein
MANVVHDQAHYRSPAECGTNSGSWFGEGFVIDGKELLKEYEAGRHDRQDETPG